MNKLLHNEKPCMCDVNGRSLHFPSISKLGFPHVSYDKEHITPHDYHHRFTAMISVLLNLAYAFATLSPYLPHVALP